MNWNFFFFSVLCEELPIIKNGQLLLNEKNATFSVNETISYTCDEDFRTDEIDPKVTCILKENVATWTEGVCKRKINFNIYFLNTFNKKENCQLEKLSSSYMTIIKVLLFFSCTSVLISFYLQRKKSV